MRGIGALGKALRLSKTTIGLAETGLGALIMRYVENFREASDVYKTIDSDETRAKLMQKYLPDMQKEIDALYNVMPPIDPETGSTPQSYIDSRKQQEDAIRQRYLGKIDSDIKKAASSAAALDYTANYANLAFDVIQLGAILRPLKGLTRNVEGITGKLATAGDELLAAPKYAPTSRIGKITATITNPAKVGLAEWTEGIAS